MSTELRVLAFSVALIFIQFFTTSYFYLKQRGSRWNASNRDQPAPILVGVGGRVERSYKNIMETFPLFLTAIALVEFSGTQNSISGAGSLIYIISRVLYFPIYAFGIPFWRTLVWGVSIVGILMIYSASILG